MKKTLGVFCVLVVVIAFTAWQSEGNFLSPGNVYNVLQRASLYGILGIGAAFAIMAGGIDLSIGSLIGLVGTLVPLLMVEAEWSATAAIFAALAVAAALGLCHGLLVTKLRLQPFIVTLCGFMLYRGIARYISNDRTLSLPAGHESLRDLALGKVPLPGAPEYMLPIPLFIMLAVAVIAAVFLNWTIYGRYILAVGRNESAARFSGINTERIVVLSYIISAVVAGGLGGLLFLLYLPSIQPSQHGSMYELYAIAAAVLGGCSLRGGEGSILGVVLGAALIPVLYNASNLLDISTTLELATIGFVILAGAIVDEVVKRVVANRRRRLEGR